MRSKVPSIPQRTSTALALAVIFLLVFVATPWAQGQTFTVLHRFTGNDGSFPEAGLVRDAAGNLYGTTLNGGDQNCSGGCGSVFKLDKTSKETILYSFTGGSDGEYPNAGLVRDEAGNLYGTTVAGGVSGTGCPEYTTCGVVFKLDTTGKETVLYTFTGGADGGTSYARLVRDSAGNLYGTTAGGGAFASGVVFKLDATGHETVLHTFTGGADGGLPYAGLVRDSAGNLYGATLLPRKGRSA
jgi:uncharacterized repeat protein (TIGR03803 family)